MTTRLDSSNEKVSAHQRGLKEEGKASTFAGVAFV